MKIGLNVNRSNLLIFFTLSRSTRDNFKYEGIILKIRFISFLWIIIISLFMYIWKMVSKEVKRKENKKRTTTMDDNMPIDMPTIIEALNYVAIGYIYKLISNQIRKKISQAGDHYNTLRHSKKSSSAWKKNWFHSRTFMNFFHPCVSILSFFFLDKKSFSLLFFLCIIFLKI